MKLIQISSIFFAFILITIFQVHAQNTGTIKGAVHSHKGTVMSDVNVAILGTNKGAYTNKNGNFAITDVSTGEQTLRISTIGYEKISKKANVQAGKTVRVHIILQQNISQLSEIMVKGGGFETRDRTETVNSVNIATIKDSHITNAEDVLRQVPGVEIGAYHQGGVANVFSMRGFGGAGHGGEAAIAIDGISLNEAEGHSDGYADMNLIIPLNISKVDVYKGPTSVLFGRYGKAGSLSFKTRKGGNYQDLSLKGGSFQTFDGQIAIGQPFKVAKKKLKTNFAAQLHRTKGYAENSKFLKGSLNGRVAYDLSDQTDIALSVKGYSGEWDAPGFISGDQFHNKDRRNEQAKNAEDDGGSKNFVSERVDLNHSFTENLRLLVFGYSVQQDYHRFAKFSIQPGGQTEDYNSRRVYTTGANLNGRHSIGSVGINWVGGLEFYNELTDSKNWNTQNRVRQELNENRDYKIQSYSAFGQGEFEISPYFRPMIGFRYDLYDGNLEIHNQDGSTEKKSLNNLTHFSPKVGFRSTLFEGFDFRANISNGFTLPSGITRYDSDMDVDPSEIWQYEAGVEYAYRQFLDFSLTGFVLNTTDEVTETAPGSREFINSGKTQRRGLELGIEAQPLKRLRIEGTLTYTKTEILDNVNEELEGKEVANIPRAMGQFSVEYTLKSGLGAQISLKDLGKYATGADNSFYYNGYTRADATLFYNFGGAFSRKGQIYFELNNAFNENYATTVFDSFGPEGGQSYAPAPLRNFSVGVTYNL